MLDHLDIGTKVLLVTAEGSLGQVSISLFLELLVGAHRLTRGRVRPFAINLFELRIILGLEGVQVLVRIPDALDDLVGHALLFHSLLGVRKKVL